MSQINWDREDVSREARLFAERAARSISEVQQNFSNVADVLVFLEVLGYTNKDVSKYGFANLLDLANYVFDFIEFYRPESKEAEPAELLATVKSAKRRVLEGLALAFPILGMLAILMISGVSLWMTRVLSEQITTAFMAGVFLGILVTEGSMQAFDRLFSFYYVQGNMGEAKRVLRRNYNVVLATLVATTIALLLVGFLANLPIPLVWITIYSTTTIALHRSSYMLLFSLRKIGHLALGYAGALVALVVVYYYTQDLIPNIVARYFFSLLVAFAVLSVPAIYFHSKVMTGSTNPAKGAPHFYTPLSTGDSTVLSRFGIQLWETIPYFVFGTFYFLMIFADRIISWIFNPLVTEFGSALPFEFNSTYHVGADPALIILLVTTIIAYILLTPIYDRISNMVSRQKVLEAGAVEDFLQSTYNKVLLISMTTSVMLAFALNYEAIPIIQLLGGGVASLQILRAASIAYVFYSIFFVNGMFLNLVNRIKPVALISVVCTMIVVTVGILFGLVGFQYIIWGTLASAFIAMISSTVYTLSLRGKFSTLFFSKYV